MRPQDRHLLRHGKAASGTISPGDLPGSARATSYRRRHGLADVPW
jgi:hypothetical protein